MEDPQKGSSVGDQIQTCLSDKIERLSIPVAAEKLSVAVRPAVLPSADPLTVAAAVFQKKNTAIISANTGHLSKCGNRVREGASRERRNYGIEI